MLGYIIKDNVSWLVQTIKSIWSFFLSRLCGHSKDYNTHQPLGAEQSCCSLPQSVWSFKQSKQESTRRASDVSAGTEQMSTLIKQHADRNIYLLLRIHGRSGLSRWHNKTLSPWNPELKNGRIICDSATAPCTAVAIRPSEGERQNEPELPAWRAEWWADGFGCMIY